MKQLIQNIWDRTIINGYSYLSKEVDRKFIKAKTIVSVFYLFIVFLSVQSFTKYSQMPKWQLVLSSHNKFNPICVVQWVNYLDWEVAVRGIYIAFFLVSSLNLFLWNTVRLSRIIVFLSMLAYMGLISSFGKIDHFMHITLVISFILIFLPKLKKKERYKINFLSMVWWCQVYILLTYFSSGIFKLLFLIKQTYLGERSALSPDSLGQHVAQTMLAHNNNYFFSSFILQNPNIFFSILLIAGFLLEFLSCYIIFKPQFHKIWGFSLILLHSFIAMSVGADFSVHAFTVGLFIMYSPFSTSSTIRQSFKHKRTKLDEINPIVLFDENCTFSNRILAFYHGVAISKTSSVGKKYVELYPELESLESLIVIKPGNTVLIKSDALCWLTTRRKAFYIICKSAQLLSPLFFDMLLTILCKIYRYRK